MSAIDRWWDEGACHGLGDLMFPESENSGPGLRLAKKTCVGCPVVDECLADALERGEAFGVRGGLSTPERQAHTAGAPIRTCPRCGLLYAAEPDRGRCHGCTPHRKVPPPTEHDPTPDARCGTRAGWWAHKRRGEHPCNPCCDAERFRPRRQDRQPRARIQSFDQHNVDMAVAGTPPAVLTSAERRAVCAALIAGAHLPRQQMAQLMRCTVRTAVRTVAALHREAAA